jgi:hypothetical protein
VDVTIELLQFFGGYPVFQVLTASCFSDLETLKIFTFNIELQGITYKSSTLVFCVPIASNLLSVFLVKTG